MIKQAKLILVRKAKHKLSLAHGTTTREKSPYKFKKYRIAKCKEFPIRNLCIARKDGGREIDRSEFTESLALNNKRYKENYSLYRKRQVIKEYIFGTIKRQSGYDHTNLRGLEKVGGEHSLVMLVYNINRVLNILSMRDVLGKLNTGRHLTEDLYCLVL